MNKYRKLINNSLVFTIGSFGSKIISFLMVPLYTNVLSTTEYGTVDLITVTVSWLLPILSLELGQAALRFAVDTKTEDEKFQLNSILMFHVLIVTAIFVLFSPIVLIFNDFDNKLIYFIILLLLNLYNNLYSQFIRGIGFIKEYAINGILMTIVTVLSNIFLLLVFDFKVEGYIISLILASLISNIYLTNLIGIKKIFTNFKINRNLYSTLVKFSFPIIPNTIMWWIINGSTRYFVLFFVGTAANGLYAVASKIPSIISLFTGIFAQAWQLSSFEEYESDDKDDYYTKIFNVYSTLLFIAGSVVLVILKPTLSIIIDEKYYLSWQIVPGLILAVIYQSFSSFLGTNYTAARETRGTFKTSLYAGIVSLITGFLLVPSLGTIGGSLSSAIGFFIMFLSRFFDTRKFVIIRIEMKVFILSNIILIIQAISMFFMEGLILITIQFLLFIILILINNKFILTLLKNVSGYFRKK